MSQTTNLVAIAENLWSVDGQASLMPGVKFPARATIVRLASGGVMIHSPVSFSAETVAEISRLGDVTTLFSPNLFHHLFLGRAQEQFPTASTVCGAGMEAKCKGLRVDAVYGDAMHGDSLPLNLGDDFDSVFISGSPRFDEVVLLHRATQTLIVGDYFFNIQKTQGLLTPLILKITGTHKKATQSKLWRKMTKDRDAMARSAAQVLALDYTRVVMCHGDVVEDGRAFTTEALSWLAES